MQPLSNSKHDASKTNGCTVLGIGVLSLNVMSLFWIAEASKLNGELRGALEECSAAKARVLRHLEEAQGKDDMIESLKERIASLESAAESMNSDQNALQGRYEEAQSLLEDFHREVDSLRGTCEALRKENGTLSPLVDELDNARAERGELEEARRGLMLELEAERAAHRRSRDEHARVLLDHEEVHRRTHDEHRITLMELESVSGERRKLSEAGRAAQDEIQRLIARSQSLEERNSMLLLDVDRLNSQVLSLEGITSGLEERLRAKEGGYEEGEAELGRELRVAREELASLRPKASQVITPFIFSIQILVPLHFCYPTLNHKS